MDSIHPSEEASTAPEHVPFLRRVTIRNYKSIEAADVSLGKLTILVGRNGSGKSNFLDALHFTADSLRISPDQALELRGGFNEVAGRYGPMSFSVQLELVLQDEQIARYAFVVGAGSGAYSSRHEVGFRVAREELRLETLSGSSIAHYSITKGKMTDSSIDKMPPAFADRLYLVNASGFNEFKACYDALSSMSFYNLNPNAMKSLRPPGAGETLRSDGGNLASIVSRLEAEKPEVMARITDYLSAIVPGIVGLDRLLLGPVETLRFKQQIEGSSRPLEFFAWSMSDGTLRALGELVAVNQVTSLGVPLGLVGIEEPETALHPAAAGALMDALREASSNTQVLVTSHSPDLLDQVDLETDRLLAVVSEGGRTRIAPIDEASREAIRNYLFTTGELLRLDQLEPNRNDLKRQEKQTSLTGEDKA